jgi:HK97 gp10 family phage protein
MALNDGSLTFSGREGFRGDRSNTVRIEGNEEIIGRLFALPGNIGRRYLRRAVSAAMRPMKAQLLANTPQGPTGNLRAAVGEKVAIYASGTVFGVVGYRRAVSKSHHKGQKGFASHLVEFGTAERRPRKARLLSSQGIAGWRPPGWSGRWPMVAKRAGPMRAQHPMLRAYQSVAAQSASILETQMAAALKDAIADSGGTA